MPTKFRVCAVLLALTIAAAGFAQDDGEVYSGLAMRTRPNPTGRSPITFSITRWTTGSERNEILKALVEKGQPGATEVLRNSESTGYPRIINRGDQRTSVPSQYAWLTEDGDKRRIVILVDRYVPMFGSVMRPPDNEHDLTFITFEVDADGKGEGTMVSGVKVKVDDENALVIDSALTRPIAVKNIARTN